MNKKKKAPECVKIYLNSSFNNTKITVSDFDGNVVSTDSSGMQGFKGAKKNTPFAAQRCALSIVKKLMLLGVKSAHLLISGPGSGRDSAIKAISNGGIEIKTITDITKFPFNGCRPPKKRRI